jgi:hypothetical protein
MQQSFNLRSKKIMEDEQLKQEQIKMLKKLEKDLKTSLKEVNLEKNQSKLTKINSALEDNDRILYAIENKLYSNEVRRNLSIDEHLDNVFNKNKLIAEKNKVDLETVYEAKDKFKQSNPLRGKKITLKQVDEQKAYKSFDQFAKRNKNAENELDFAAIHPERVKPIEYQDNPMRAANKAEVNNIPNNTNNDIIKTR